MNFFRRCCCIGLPILCILLWCPHANAEDDANAVVLSSNMRAIPIGSVKIAAAAITLHGRTVNVSITTQAGDAAAIIDVQGPQFKWLGEQDSYPDRQFPELKISIDHVPASLQDHSKAFFNGTDITGELQDDGIDLFTISQSPPVLFATPKNQQSFNWLLASGAIMQLGGQDVAAWSARRDVSFALTEGAHLVTLQYNARPAITLLPPAQLPAALPLASYCLPAESFRRAAILAAKSGYVLAVQYAIPAAINGDAPASVAINLASPGGAATPAAMAFFCAPDGKPVTAANAAIQTLAKPDAYGVVHVLTLGSDHGG